MKIGKDFDYYKDKTQRTFFTWIPFNLNGKTRWLEKVTVYVYYYVGEASGYIRFMDKEIVE